MAQRVTVYDIARKLDISPSTVSRVLNNSSLISDERTRQIRQAAEEMGYRRRAIKKQVSRAILNIHLFLPLAGNTLIHFFYNLSELIDSIQEGFGNVRLNITTRINDGNLEFLSFKKTGHIDGCVFAFTSPGVELSNALNEREIPVVLLNRRSPDHSFVYYDTQEAMRSLTEVVLQKKGNDIRPCYIAFNSLKKLSLERYSGVEKAFASHAIPFGEQNLLFIDDLQAIGKTAIPWIEKNSFNTIFAFNDFFALSLLQSFTSRNIQVPGQIALTGFDNSPLLKMIERSITTMNLSIPELGIKAGEWLNRAIIDKDNSPMQEILPVDYIEGETI